MPDRGNRGGPGDDGDIDTWYVVDAEDRVTAVCPQWDQVAVQGQGSERAMASGVIGLPLNRFISGDATRMFMDAALQAVRLTGRPRTLQHRCDTPTVRRRLEMTLVPLGGGGVRIEHRLIERQSRARTLVCETDAGSVNAKAEPVWRCSLCLRIQRAGLPWQASELLASARLVVRYTVCPRCRGD